MNKLEELTEALSAYGRLAVAYSGGVDSTFLLRVAHDALDGQVTAFLIDSPVLARRDQREAIAWLESLKIPYEAIEGNPFDVEAFVANERRRCYYCKKNYYAEMVDRAKEAGFLHIADGQNADDALSNDRPGAEAALELGVVSPLKDCGLSKEDIRRLSHELGLPTWDKPSNACLATRIPFGTRITREALAQAEAAEEVLRRRGMEGCRVRCHGELARIEALRDYFDALMNDETIIAELKALGFKYVTLDLEGFRSGSMN